MDNQAIQRCDSASGSICAGKPNGQDKPCEALPPDLKTSGGLFSLLIFLLSLFTFLGVSVMKMAGQSSICSCCRSWPDEENYGALDTNPFWYTPEAEFLLVVSFTLWFRTPASFSLNIKEWKYTSQSKVNPGQWSSHQLCQSQLSLNKENEEL